MSNGAFKGGGALVGDSLEDDLVGKEPGLVAGAGMAIIRRQRLKPAMLKGIGVAALAHGLFDFLTLSPLMRIFSALLILVAWLWRIRTVERLSKQKKGA